MTIDPVAVRAHPDVRALHPDIQRAYLALLVARARDGWLTRADARRGIATALAVPAPIAVLVSRPTVGHVARTLLDAGLLAVVDDELLDVFTPAQRDDALVFAAGAAAVRAGWAAQTTRAIAEAEQVELLGALTGAQWAELMDWVARWGAHATEEAA